MKTRGGTQGDRGAAVITVLAMLTIMGALAATTIEAARFSLLRASNQAGMDQARWYLLGAEAYAVSKIGALDGGPEAARIDQEVWQGRPIVYPLDEGTLTIQLRDGSNCFNLNSVVERQESGELVSSARGQIQFARLLDLADVRTGGALGAALADWLDSDQTPLPGGAEDGAADETYRTADTLIADVSELRRVRGFDAEILARLAPHVCARPIAAPNVLNVNTLIAADAVQLSIAFGDAMAPARARALIRARPRGGWADVDAFFAQPMLAGMEIAPAFRAQFAVNPHYIVAHARVRIGDTTESAAALIETGARPAVVRRVFGVGAAERAL